MSNPILENLTPAQLQAVTHKDGPMLVIAGAGSGKTRVVTRRIAWLQSQGVWPSQILAMTFTNKAAREMRERVAALAGEAPVNLGTFHGCCARFLRKDIERLDCGRNSDFTIYDATDQASLLTNIISRLPGAPKQLSASLAGHFIGTAKNRDLAYEELARKEDFGSVSGEMLTEVAREYDRRLRESNALDFDDLLLMMVRLLREQPAIREIYNSRFRYILIDEYQDTNHLQYLLMKLLAGEHENVHVTGDPDQAIYSWRGADYGNIMSFVTDFPDAKVVKLEENYRSTPNILNAANAVISHNKERFEKNLFTHNRNASVIIDLLADDSDLEAEWVRRKIAALHSKGYPWRDFAIFYRTNAQSAPFEKAFKRYGIPYQILGGLRFYERKEIRDLLALLRLKANPNDHVAFLRITENFQQCKGIGKRTAEQLIGGAAAAGLQLLDYLAGEDFRKLQKGRSEKSRRLIRFSEWLQGIKEASSAPADDAVNEILDAAGFLDGIEDQYGSDNIDARRENVESFLSDVFTFTQGHPKAQLAEFLEEISLVADVDAHDPDADNVVMMTLHSAKGLEFPCVFITGVEEGLLPHSMAVDSNGDPAPDKIEEERRLFYVGLTRAEKAAFVTHAKMRYRYEMRIPQPVDTSHFLLEIPRELRILREYTNHVEIPRHSDEYDTPYSMGGDDYYGGWRRHR